MDHGELLPLDAVRDATRDATNAIWEENGAEAVGDEKGQKELVVRGEAVDMAVSLVSLHHDVFAPIIEPQSVERKWVIEIPDHPADLGGMIDVDEGDTIIDLKTIGKTPGPMDAHDRDQLTIYSLAKYRIDGIIPRVRVNYLIKGKEVGHVSQWTNRDMEDYKLWFKKYDAVCRAINSGSFPPTSQSQWYCSLENCGFARQHCGYYRRVR